MSDEDTRNGRRGRRKIDGAWLEQGQEYFERAWILEGDQHMKAILLNKKVGREERRDESIKVGKDGEVRETEIRKKERFTWVGK